MNQLAPITASMGLPTLVTRAGERASLRFLEFFAANIRNPHTRRAYGRAVTEFLAWCDEQGVPSIDAVQPLHVAAWIETQTRKHAAPTVKLRLAALRHLFDWLVTGQVMPANPAGSVRGPSHVVKAGKTPVLAPEEARALIDAIEITTHAGLRDRALIGLMVFSFARIGAALGMKVEDVFTQNRRLWVRLREKGGKPHAMPCHHNLETYLTAYIEGAGLADDPKGALFRTIGRGTGLLTRTPLPQPNAYAMIGRRAGAAGIVTKVGGGEDQGLMLDELVTQIPKVGDLLALTPPQLDSVLLKCIAQRSPGTVFEDEIVGLFPIGVKANYQQRLAADNALMEAWQRLKSAGLIMQAPGQAARVMTITAKGRDAAVSVRSEEIAVRQMLRREMLHSALQGAVYENFSGGNYDTAVRDAYVQVEIAVRDAVEPPASLVGVKLMREAFNPHTGKLTNMALPMPERERMADLFAGAIGTFKNPLSHRKVGNIEPQPVIEELMFASRLLRFIKP